MTIDMIITLSTLTGAMVLFALDKLRLDIVAMLSLLVLLVAGILSPQQALAGFAAPTVILIAALFVVSEGISATGLAARLSGRLGELAGSSEVGLLVVSMVATAVMSAFMSSTGAVALMLPVILTLCKKNNINPSKVLIPVAFAASLGGMLTLIGTPPNLVVNGVLQNAGLESFEFFSFTPIGLLMLVAGVLFMLLIGRKILPSRDSEDKDNDDKVESVSTSSVLQSFDLKESIHWLRVREQSNLVGRSVEDSDFTKTYGVTPLALQSKDELGKPVDSSSTLAKHTILEANRILVVHGTRTDVTNLAAKELIDVLPRGAKASDLVSDSLGFSEVFILPRSPLIGKTLRDVVFENQYGVFVLGIKRADKRQETGLGDVKLMAGDTLLVQGPWRSIMLLGDRGHGFLVTGVPKELAEKRLAKSGGRAPIAATILLSMIVVMCLGVSAPVIVALVSAMAMVLSGCVAPIRIYRSINWESLVLIAAMLPMATALQETGATDLIVTKLAPTMGGLGNLGLIAGFFVVTSLMSLVVSNTATTVIIAPVALQVAMETGNNPMALLMTIAIAASSAFGTPMASPINTLVMTAGGYRFVDYVKTGLPLQLLLLILSVIFIPLMFPG
ncbi:MAG: di/tricarboxylate transporter [Planctomycetota bacterium]|jgi:di/tricarboxylate transporter